VLGRRSVHDALMDDSTRFARRVDPLLSYDLRPGRFDNNVQEPSVVVVHDSVVLYYIGLGLQLPDQPIDAPGQGIQSVGLGRAVPGFNDWGLMAPTAAFEGSRVVLFYTAFGSTPGACAPVVSGGRFGQPVAGGSRCMFATIGRAVAAPPAGP